MSEKVNPNVGTASPSLEERPSSQAPRRDDVPNGRIPWSRRLNPLKSNTIPPVPDERQPSGEHTANFLSKLVFHWVTPLMRVSSRCLFLLICSPFFSMTVHYSLLIECLINLYYRSGTSGHWNQMTFGS